MKIAFVGCGYVADVYVQTVTLHSNLELVAVYDHDAERLAHFCDFHDVPAVDSLDAILGDESIELVLNLTNPHAHYEISKALLLAGKHVYSEKPLAMAMPEATELVELAEEKGLLIVSAPCSVLGESAQTMWKAVREKAVGEMYAVYAEMDDGLVHRMPYRHWQSVSGKDWPAKDEFETGCTLEHSGYVLGWLCAMFGPAESVTAFGARTIADKKTDEPLTVSTPDLTICAIQFASGIAARLTCSIVAPHDHEFRIFGEDGILGTDDTWDYRSPVWVKKLYNVRRRLIVSPFKRKRPLLGKQNRMIKYGSASFMDHCRGPSEMVASLEEGRPCRLSPRFTLHVNELALAIHEAREGGLCHTMQTTFEPMEPMPWAS